MTLIGSRYETIRELGRGGMGQILLARQLNLGRLVVIKRPLAEDSFVSIQALLVEARLAAKLSHPAIVGILDVSADPPYIAMEYVAGLTLREMIAGASRGLPPAVALTIALDILRGLVYAHGDPGVIHRDIKPRNIIVTFGGYSKVIDFGISRWLSPEGAWESTSAAGTPGYMPPEQQSGARLDARVDQFAVGVTLREMLVGQHSMASAPAPKALAPELSAIIDQATASQPEDRYSSCADLAAALEEYAETAGIAPSQVVVESWIRDHHADAIDAWRRESSGKIDTNILTTPQLRSSGKIKTEKLTPSPLERHALGTAPTARDAPQSLEAPTALDAPPSRDARQSEPPHATRRPHPRRGYWVLAAFVLAAGMAALAFALTRGAGAPDVLVVELAAKNLGAPDEAWLGPAIEQLTRHALRDAGGRRFQLAHKGVPPTTMLEISYQVTAHGVTLEAKNPHSGALLAREDGASVASATAVLVERLVAKLGNGRAIAGPDAEEAEQMAKLGARTYDQYRRYRTLTEQVRLSGYMDPTGAAEQLQTLQREDPAWAHVYGDLAWTRASGEQVLLDTLKDGRHRSDRARDPAGIAILEAEEANAELRFADAERIAKPVFQQNDTDLVAGETLYRALFMQDKNDDARAVQRRLYEQFPVGYFGGDMVSELDRAGRRDQALALASSILTEHPHNVTVVRELVRLEADRGNVEIARRWAKRLLLLYGESPLAQTDAFEVMLAIDDLTNAQRLADAMLLGTPLMRARGYYRSAVVAVYEGRFEIAQAAVREAIKLFPSFGEQSELPQSVALARAIAQLRHDSAAVAEGSQRLAKYFDEEMHDPGGVVDYRYREHIERTGKCMPDPTPSSLDEEARTIVRRDILRAGVEAGCTTCDAVVEAGFRVGETTSEPLIQYALCARKVDVASAKQALTIATAWSSWGSAVDSTPVHAILAQYHLAGILAELGDKAGARARYERFLRYWGEMSNPIPEIARARAALSTL